METQDSLQTLARLTPADLDQAPEYLCHRRAGSQAQSRSQGP
ncbi:MAG: hypothetical protein WKG07_21270 [Hymenobacter sp.]